MSKGEFCDPAAAIDASMLNADGAKRPVRLLHHATRDTGRLWF